MMHKQRVFSVVSVYHGEDISPASLASLLTRHSWTLCSGFRLGHLLFVNDATSEDGAQEFAVFDERLGKQVESLTCSWIQPDQLQAMILDLLAGAQGVESWGSMPRLDHPAGSCHHCA